VTDRYTKARPQRPTAPLAPFPDQEDHPQAAAEARGQAAIPALTWRNPACGSQAEMTCHNSSVDPGLGPARWRGSWPPGSVGRLGPGGAVARCRAKRIQHQPSRLSPARSRRSTSGFGGFHRRSALCGFCGIPAPPGALPARRGSGGSWPCATAGYPAHPCGSVPPSGALPWLREWMTMLSRTGPVIWSPRTALNNP
jgi:hypothetical protein